MDGMVRGGAPSTLDEGLDDGDTCPVKCAGSLSRANSMHMAWWMEPSLYFGVKVWVCSLCGNVTVRGGG